jgi:hypothetical protein
MPASVTRNEYYWINDRLEQMVNCRASVYRAWKLKGSKHQLVASIEDRGSSKKIEHGHAATTSRIAHALLRDERLHTDPDTQDIGANIPKELVNQSSSVIESAIREITLQYSRLSNEERRTGALQYELNKNGVFEYAGWQLTIILQGFTPNPKEKKTGADVGVIVDVKHLGKQVSKGFWAQAKQADSMPNDPLTLQDMKMQMEDMLNRTREAYGMIYTPKGVALFQGLNSGENTTLSKLIDDVTSCRRGDRRPEFLADTIHRDYLVELKFESLAISKSTSSTAFSWKKDGF